MRMGGRIMLRHEVRRLLVVVLAAFAALGVAGVAFAGVPAGYPASYGEIVARAQREGRVVVYSTTDSASVAPMLEDFRSLYPFVQVEYHDLNSNEVYNRFISEVAAGAGTADLLWSAAMDLQMKLVADGYAQTYESPEKPGLPSWAVWQNQAYATTLEPAVIVYNRRLVPADAVPNSHDDLLRLLRERPGQLAGKVGMLDPEKSGFSFMLVTEDLKLYPHFWALAEAFGRSQIGLYSSSGVVIERVSSGEHLLGYNVIGSYAALRSQTDPAIGMVLPVDYTLAFSRLAFISRAARHPNAARLFLDYLLSRRAQTLLARAWVYALRSDAEGPATAAALAREVGDALKPIPVGPDLVEYLNNPARRLDFINRWKAALRR